MNRTQHQAQRRRQMMRELARLTRQWQALEVIKQRLLLEMQKEQRQIALHAEYIREMRGHG